MQLSPPGGSTPKPDIEATAQEETEVQLGRDERGTAANAALRALARASRSYLIYDARNQAIRGFLEELQRHFRVYQSRFGTMSLVVRPFELTLEGEVVYLERDRERSLAFKLFRDGVRSLTIGDDADWQELTHLLEILSVRYVGIHQNPAEDDVVTLLWKAGFAHIRFEAVEGVMPDDEDGGGDAIGAGIAGSGEAGGSWSSPGDLSQARVPSDFDLPAPRLEQARAVVFRPLDPLRRQALLDEDTSSALPTLALHLVQALLTAAADPTDPLSIAEADSCLREIRDFLLAEDQLQYLLELLQQLRAFRQSVPESTERIDAILAGAFDARALGRIIQSIPRDLERPPETFFALLDLMPDAPVRTLLDLIEQERAPHTRRILRTLLEHFLPEHSAAVLARLNATSGSVAADLLQTLAHTSPEAAQSAISGFIKRDDYAVQLEFLTLARDQTLGPHTRSMLALLLHASQEDVRLKTLELMAAQREAGAFPVVCRQAEERHKTASRQEIAALGQTLAALNPARARQLFEGWSQPGTRLQRLLYLRNPFHERFPALVGLLQRLVPPRVPATLLKVAVEGSQALPAGGGDELLKTLAHHGIKDVRQAAQQARARRLSARNPVAGEETRPLSAASTGDPQPLSLPEDGANP